jgi:hypothetical protein
MGMTRRIGWLSALAFAATATLATAANKQSVNVELFQKTTWNGKELAAGPYTISWQGEPTDLKVLVLRGSRVVAEGQGRFEEREARASNDAVVSRRDGSGAYVLSAVQFAKKNTVLVLAGS